MTGHRATVTVGGVRWELHADGSRTATVKGVQFVADPAIGKGRHRLSHRKGESLEYIGTVATERLTRLAEGFA